jgi:hypothetical protein
MRVTINRVDNQVVVGGMARPIDCSHLPSYVSLVQWDDGAVSGWIEFINDGRGAFMPNCKIVDLAPYRPLIDAWVGIADALAQEAERAAAEQAQALPALEQTLTELTAAADVAVKAVTAAAGETDIMAAKSVAFAAQNAAAGAQRGLDAARKLATAQAERARALRADATAAADKRAALRFS